MNSALAPVIVSRYIDAPPQRIFDAFLIPENAGRGLFSTPAGKIFRAEIDPRVGGKFLFTDRRAAQDLAHSGEYLALVPG
ncbi:MAG: SRPBCC domain-containing protein, partial [Elusimicrobia bacterium]|nr:SRPBCC domain-containing protein [Elusimicrobiota bacterium]